MRLLRAWWRLLLLFLLSIVLAVPVILLRLLLLPLGRRARRFSLPAAAHLQRVWARSTLRILGVRVQQPATPPPGGCLIVSNHLSYLDIPVIASVLPCRFVSKAEVAEWPVVGTLAKLAHVLFLDRQRRSAVRDVGEEMRDTLAAGMTVTFFPEGTSTSGAAVGRFHAGLLEPAAALGVPCLAFAIRYETPGEIAAPSCTICWWGDMAFPPHVWNLMKLRRIDVTVRWSERLLRDSDRKVLAVSLHEQVTRLFVPVRQEDGRPAELAVSP